MPSHPALSVASVGGDNVSLMGEEEETLSPDDCVLHGRPQNSESLQNLEFTLRHLPSVRCQELYELLCSFTELFEDRKPIKQHFYRVLSEKWELMEREIQYMQDHNIAVPLSSDWAFPCLLIGKADSTIRFCTDFCKVNSLTKLNCFPLPHTEDCGDQVGSAKFVSKFDLLKGY